MVTSSRKASSLKKIPDLFDLRLVVLVKMCGLNAQEAFSIRRSMWDLDSNFMVVKNSVARIAVSKLGLDFLSGFFCGPVALAYSRADIPSFLRLTLKLSDEYGQEKFDVLAGECEGRFVSRESIKSISLFSDESSVYSDLLSSINSSASGLLSALNIPSAFLLNYLQLRCDSDK